MPQQLTIAPAETPHEREEFIRFQWKVYRGDPFWVPPLLSERREFMDPVNGHPFHRHAKVRYFLARRGGEVVGRIAAFTNHRHNEFWNDRVGFFGLYEVLDDPEASAGLFEAAEEFLRGEGMTAARGPMNFSTNEEVGLLVQGWNGPPVIMMTYNPRYYADLITGAGYEKVMDLLAYTTDLTRIEADGTGVDPRVVRVAQKVRERYDLTVRKIDMDNFDGEAQRIKDVYNAAWAKNWGFVPLTEEEMNHLAHELRQFADPETILFAEKDGKPIAFTLPFPDLCQPLLRAYPRPGVPEAWTLAKLAYWWKVRGAITTIRAAVGGVVEEYRGRGVDAVLFLEGLRACIRQGYRRMEISWVLENNIPMRQTAKAFNGEIYRTYRIYEKALGAGGVRKKHTPASGIRQRQDGRRGLSPSTVLPSAS